jgi:hypothetical protein
MSATPPTDPKNPQEEAKNQLNNAIIWTVIAAVISGALFYYSGKVIPENKTFYMVGGAIAAILTVVNGYGAWTTYNKSKPPTSPK